MTSESKAMSDEDIKGAICAQILITRAFAVFLERTFPGKGILEAFTDLQMRYQMPPSIYRDPSITRYTPDGAE